MQLNQARVDDYSLMNAIAQGDQPALGALYERHSGLVYAVCLRILGNRAEAEDLLIDVFYELWTIAGRYDAARANPLTYLLTIARSRAIDRRRRKSHSVQVDADSASREAAPENIGPLATTLYHEQHDRIQQALALLDVNQRQAIECSFFDGMSHSEIAEKLSKPLGTVKTYIRQALIQLRRNLRNDYRL